MQEKLENVYDKAIFVLFAGHVLFAAVLVHKDQGWRPSCRSGGTNYRPGFCKAKNRTKATKLK